MGREVQPILFLAGGFQALLQSNIVCRFKLDQFIDAFTDASVELRTGPWRSLGETGHTDDLGLELLLLFLAAAHLNPVGSMNRSTLPLREALPLLVEFEKLSTVIHKTIFHNIRLRGSHGGASGFGSPLALEHLRPGVAQGAEVPPGFSDAIGGFVEVAFEQPAIHVFV